MNPEYAAYSARCTEFLGYGIGNRRPFGAKPHYFILRRKSGALEGGARH